MQTLKRILLAEDNSKDLELTLAGLKECDLADEVFVVRDGTEVLDFLRQRGPFAGRPGGLPSILFLDLKMPKMNGLESSGR
jgi:CheY-like chemotaxis protein